MKPEFARGLELALLQALIMTAHAAEHGLGPHAKTPRPKLGKILSGRTNMVYDTHKDVRQGCQAALVNATADGLRCSAHPLTRPTRVEITVIWLLYGKQEVISVKRRLRMSYSPLEDMVRWLQVH